jgi:transposase
VLKQAQDNEEMSERFAALDIGKAGLVCCSWVAEGQPGRQLQEVESYSTLTPSLLSLCDRLACLG